MHSIDNQLIFSATDLSHFLACPHLSLLSRRAVLVGPKPPVYDDPSLEVLWQRGLQHEQQHLARFRDEGKRVVELTEPQEASTIRDRWIAAAAATRDAMQSGADVIYQATLFDGSWIGKADFLIRVEQPSALGEWSYEVVDTKLAREAKGGALLQVLLYAELRQTSPRHPIRSSIATSARGAACAATSVATLTISRSSPASPAISVACCASVVSSAWHRSRRGKSNRMIEVTQ